VRFNFLAGNLEQFYTFGRPHNPKTLNQCRILPTRFAYMGKSRHEILGRLGKFGSKNMNINFLAKRRLPLTVTAALLASFVA